MFYLQCVSGQTSPRPVWAPRGRTGHRPIRADDPFAVIKFGPSSAPLFPLNLPLLVAVRYPDPLGHDWLVMCTAEYLRIFTRSPYPHSHTLVKVYRELEYMGLDQEHLVLADDKKTCDYQVRITESVPMALCKI